MKEIFEIKSRMDYENLMSYASAMGFEWRSGAEPFEYLPPNRYPYSIEVSRGIISYNSYVPSVGVATMPTKEYL